MPCSRRARRGRAQWSWWKASVVRTTSGSTGIVDGDFIDPAGGTSLDPGIHRLPRYTLENYLLEPDGWAHVAELVTRGSLPDGWRTVDDVWHGEVTGTAVLKVFLNMLMRAAKMPTHQHDLLCSMYMQQRPDPHRDLRDVVDAILVEAVPRR